MRASRWLPPAIGAGVLAVALVIGFLPAGSPGAAAGGLGPASLPDRLANYSYLTGDVSASPPGRAIAIYQHGFGVEFMDFPQAVVLGADGDTYRRVDVAEDRAGAETQGDPAAMLLSPDGSRIAVGDYDTSSPDLAVVDLTTGHDERRPVPGGRSAIPLAWSPDSTQVAYLSTPEPVNPHSGTAHSGELGILDLETGTAGILPGPADARAAAFSPDGTELAVHRIAPDDGSLSGYDGVPRMGGGEIDIVDLGGGSARQITLPEHHYLDGPNAWSPDGALLATAVQWVPPCDYLIGMGDDDGWQQCVAQEGDEPVEEEGTGFVDASGRDGAVPAALPVELVGWHGVLGWTAADEALVLDSARGPDPEADTEPYWLTAVPLDGGEPRVLSAVPGGGNYGIGTFQLATALLADVEVRDAGLADRGPWPAWLRIGAAVAIAGVALLVAQRVQRRRQGGTQHGLSQS